ncbi:MAG: hypothetical protein WCL50_04850 [Spirochaetota bacterium]
MAQTLITTTDEIRAVLAARTEKDTNIYAASSRAARAILSTAVAFLVVLLVASGLFLSRPISGPIIRF